MKKETVQNISSSFKTLRTSEWPPNIGMQRIWVGVKKEEEY